MRKKTVDRATPLSQNKASNSFFIPKQSKWLNGAISKYVDVANT
jgi:hypothetical protein